MNSTGGDEFKNVKPNVKVMFESIFKIYVDYPLTIDKEVPYNLTLDSGTLIKGATDHIIQDKDFPDLALATVESKNSTEKLNLAGHKAQFLAELLAEHYKINDRTRVRPSEMCGLMTNGSDWMLARLFYREGQRLLHYVFVDRSDTEDKVAKFLIHLLEVAKTISALLRKTASSSIQKGAPKLREGERGEDGFKREDDYCDSDGDDDVSGNQNQWLSSSNHNWQSSFIYDNEDNFIAPLSTENLRTRALMN